MSFNPRGQGYGGGYARQQSYDDSRLGNSQATRFPIAGPSTTVHRRQTVRGAIPGTVREAGQDPRMSIAPQRGLTRGKTLTRPDRFVAPAPLINPQNAPGVKSATAGVIKTELVNGVPTLTTHQSWWDPWTLFVEISTFWAPRPLLRKCGMTDPIKQRAWKEKCALCEISIFLMGIVGFITLGLNRTLCPANATERFARMGDAPGKYAPSVFVTSFQADRPFFRQARLAFQAGICGSPAKHQRLSPLVQSH